MHEPHTSVETHWIDLMSRAIRVVHLQFGYQKTKFVE